MIELVYMTRSGLLIGCKRGFKVSSYKVCEVV